MNGSQIDRYLGYLDHTLAHLQQQATILLVGGAVMVTEIQNRKSTQDIDVVIAASNARTYKIVKQAINLVAKEKNLPASWLNDDVTLIVDQIGRPKAPKRAERWKHFSHLHV